MNNNMEIKELENQKKEIIKNLEKEYEDIFQLNCSIMKIALKFPEDYRERKFQITTETGKVLTYGKLSFKKVDLYSCGISAFQLKRNGLYYSYSEIVTIDNKSKFTWI